MAADGDDWAPRKDRYSVAWGSISLGEGSIALKAVGNGCFDYESLTEPVALVRWSLGSPRESSQFCVVDGKIQPRHFEYSVGKSSKDNFSLDFDSAGQRVKRIKNGTVTELALTPPVYDRFVVREAVRIWAQQHAGTIGAEQDFTVIEDGAPKTYHFAIKAREMIKTDAGSFETLRVERIDNPNKSYRYWLAPSRHYAPVRIEHVYKGKQQLLMSLLPPQ
jgi:hypothetical protein